MTVEQFRNSELSGQLADILNTPVMQIALQTCDEASPSNGGVKDWREPHIAHIQLGIDRGYNIYPQLLKTLAKPQPKVSEPIEPSYEDQEEKEEMVWQKK